MEDLVFRLRRPGIEESDLPGTLPQVPWQRGRVAHVHGRKSHLGLGHLGKFLNPEKNMKYLNPFPQDLEPEPIFVWPSHPDVGQVLGAESRKPGGPRGASGGLQGPDGRDRQRGGAGAARARSRGRARAGSRGRVVWPLDPTHLASVSRLVAPPLTVKGHQCGSQPWS